MITHESNFIFLLPTFYPKKNDRYSPTMIHRFAVSAGSLLSACLPFISHSAIISTTYSGGGINSDWNFASNWTPVGVPNNGATDQYLSLIHI